VRIYINGSAVGTVRAATNSPVTYSEDIAVAGGDHVQLYGQIDANTRGYVRRFVLYNEFSVNAVALEDNPYVTADSPEPSPTPVGGSNDSLHPHSLIEMADGSTKWLIDVRPGDMLRGRDGAAEVLGLRVGILGDKPYAVINGKCITTPGHLIPLDDGGWGAVDPDCYAACSYGQLKTVKGRRGLLTVLSGLCEPARVRKIEPGMHILRGDGEFERVQTVECITGVPYHSHTIAVLLDGSDILYSDGYAVGTLA
jgi:hypothetical protein